MGFLEFVIKEASEKQKEEWAEATDKHRDKKKASKYEARVWIKHSTNSGLKRLKGKMGKHEVGEVIDALVSRALNGGD